jgi:hyperosmotically inducible protein
MKSASEALFHPLALVCAVSFLFAGCNKAHEEVRAPSTSTALPISGTAIPPASTTVGTEIDDSVVTTRVKSALLSDPDVRSFDIKVETRKGQVQLSGYVDSQLRIDNAIAIVRNVEGVKGVDNGMSVKEGKASVGNKVDDAIVTAKVKSALLADPDVKSIDIAVVTRKGEVQLSGYVNNQMQIDRAIGVARAVEGVQGIKSEMSIKK